jgi:hypothetical protein
MDKPLNVYDVLAAGQQSVVSWCLPGAATDVLVNASNAFNVFAQVLISALTLASVVVMCIALYNALLAFKYKESTRYDWALVLGAFFTAMSVNYFFDILKAVYDVASQSQYVIVSLFVIGLVFNTAFVGYYLV